MAAFKIVGVPNLLNLVVKWNKPLLQFGVEQMFELVPQSDGRSVRSSYIESLKVIKTSNNDIERLFIDYLDHCFPSAFCTYDSFRHYMLKNNFENNDIKLKRLFHAFNRSGNGFLSFNELLMGLILIERDTPHVEFRIRFVFDYYDSKRRNLLVEEDFRKMVRDLNSDRDGRLLVQESQISQMARERMMRFKLKTVDGKQGVSFNSFLNAIGTHTFRGTSVLCRAKRNVFSNISRRITARIIKKTLDTTKGKLTEVISKKNYQGKHIN